jgi:hypothetical protein
LQVFDTAGKNLLEAVLNGAKDCGDHCGQLCDNGSNMKGQSMGLPARLLQINPKAIYVPCANHSMNLVIVDFATSSNRALRFFVVLTRLYSLFSSSSSLWTILKDCVTITLKSHCNTTWESRLNCVKPFCYYLENVTEALEKLVQ